MFSWKVKIKLSFPQLRQRKGIWNDILRLVWSSIQRWPQTVDSSFALVSLWQACHINLSRSLLSTSRDENIWLSSLFTSLTPQLTCLYWQRSCSIQSQGLQTRIKSQHVSWSMHKLMMVTEAAMLQMLKGTKSCHLSYLQKAGGSSVAYCAITYLPSGWLTSIQTQKPHVRAVTRADS